MRESAASIASFRKAVPDAGGDAFLPASTAWKYSVHAASIDAGLLFHCVYKLSKYIEFADATGAALV